MGPTKSARRRGKSGAATLHEVAQLAGVHPMTVSRALKGSTSVAEATRETILRAAQELNYTPNLAARALVMGKTGNIAVVTGPVSEHYYAHLLYLLEGELTASDYKMLFLRSRDVNQDLFSIVNANAVDGVIAIDAFFNIRNLVQSQSTFIPPCVYAGVPNPSWSPSLSIDTIKIDLTQGIRDALLSMLNSGCRRVAYLTSNPNMGATTEIRPRVYEETMEAVGHPCEIINLEIGSNTFVHDLVRRRLVEYIRTHGAPDGLFCQNDEMAIAAYRGLRDLGLDVPGDVQLVGCDGLDYMEYFDPQLSTIVQPAEQMCALAWQFLQKRMNDAHAPHQQATLEAHLRVRPSLKAFNADLT